MTPLRCPRQRVEETLALLREAGREGHECVVFWLSERPVMPGAIIREVYRPEQRAVRYMFHIPPAGMTGLMGHLRAHKSGLAAQVHSHPGSAFHSRADDEWAVVRHEGALSIVVPHFADRIDASTFLEKVATFRLAADDRWIEVPHDALPLHLELIA